MVFHLRGRFHAGDQALADELEAACGLGGPSNLRPVPVDLGELGESGESPPDHWDDPNEWLEIRSIGSRHAWEDMRDFSALLDEHPFVRDSWRRYAEQRQLGRAREWLAANGCRPSQSHERT